MKKVTSRTLSNFEQFPLWITIRKYENASWLTAWLLANGANAKNCLEDSKPVDFFQAIKIRTRTVILKNSASFAFHIQRSPKNSFPDHAWHFAPENKGPQNSFKLISCPRFFHQKYDGRRRHRDWLQSVPYLSYFELIKSFQLKRHFHQSKANTKRMKTLKWRIGLRRPQQRYLS